jgi:hypothetical protein
VEAVKLLASIGLLASGCFYTDPINQRPSADIKQTSSAEVFRNGHLSLEASTYDPEGELVTVVWRVYACTDATTFDGCDQGPFETDVLTDITFMVPAFRADNTTPVEALRVILEATDAHGATAKPDQELLLAVADQPPTLKLAKSARHGYVVGTVIDVYAQVDDEDDGATNVTLSPWKVMSPASQPPYTIVDKGPLPDDPTTYWQQFTPSPSGAGDWIIEVTATDPLGAINTQDLPITVVPDHPPCLGQWSPLAPPPGSTLPMQDPTLFQVLVIEDDLDPYPPVPSDPVLGQSTFAWSLKPPGASSFQSLAITGNSVALDPASYTPGDQLALRVEIQDRNHTPVNCPATDPTCSVISDPSCIQRLTWLVEVR